MTRKRSKEMLLYFGMLGLPIAYGVLYLRHSVRKRRRGQAVAFGALLLCLLASAAILLWEFLASP